MPRAAKTFNQSPASPTPEKPKRGNSARRGYDPAWQRFRAAYAATHPPFCAHCSKSFPSRQMHLDHIKAFHGLDDPLRFDESNLQWLCVVCHARETNTQDGGGWANYNKKL